MRITQINGFFLLFVFIYSIHSTVNVSAESESLISILDEILKNYDEVSIESV